MADQWQSAIGKGFGLAMDEIYNGLIGKGPQSALRKKDLTKFSTDDLWAATNLIPGGGAAKVATPVVKSGVKAAAATTAKALVNKALKKPQVAVRIPEARMADVIETGRLKNVFETPRPEYNKVGFNPDPHNAYLEPRVKFENSVLGIPENAAASARPVYGYNTVPGLPAIPGDSQFSKLTQLLSSANPKAKAYGDVTGILKKPSGTYTVGDSFTTALPAQQIGQSSDKTVKSIIEGLAPADKYNPFSTSGAQYIENQMPLAAGNLSNFKKFLVDNPAQVKVIADQLKQAGYKIPVKTSLDGKIAAIQNILGKIGKKPSRLVDFREQTDFVPDWYKPAPSPFD